MGDVLMSSPSFKAIKESFNCEITLLTSSQGVNVGRLIPEIDHVMGFDFPWVRVLKSGKSREVLSMIREIKERRFDGCVVFSVYSQSSLPAAFLAYLAEIPLRLAYCRENPYDLLTHWVPDKEPYTHILHQVERDLRLVAAIGAKTKNKKLSLHVKQGHVNKKLLALMGHAPSCYFVFHPGVSEQKRKYPVDYWIELGKSVYQKFQIPILLTGSREEIHLTRNIASKIGEGAISLAGIYTLEETVCLIGKARALVAVNTGPIHIAAAMQTPVLVLYAQTNPQHSPWMVPHKCIEYSIPTTLESQNEVIQFVNTTYYKETIPVPSPEIALAALQSLLIEQTKGVIETLKEE
jgi:ADP-heptose:LPS heptosyltransferase